MTTDKSHIQNSFINKIVPVRTKKIVKSQGIFSISPSKPPVSRRTPGKSSRSVDSIEFFAPASFGKLTIKFRTEYLCSTYYFCGNARLIWKLLVMKIGSQLEGTQLKMVFLQGRALERASYRELRARYPLLTIVPDLTSLVIFMKWLSSNLRNP